MKPRSPLPADVQTFVKDIQAKVAASQTPSLKLSYELARGEEELTDDDDEFQTFKVTEGVSILIHINGGAKGKYTQR
jgi:hypothetical protein